MTDAEQRDEWLYAAGSAEGYLARVDEDDRGSAVDARYHVACMLVSRRVGRDELARGVLP